MSAYFVAATLSELQWVATEALGERIQAESELDDVVTFVDAMIALKHCFDHHMAMGLTRHLWPIAVAHARAEARPPKSLKRAREDLAAATCKMECIERIHQEYLTGHKPKRLCFDSEELANSDD